MTDIDRAIARMHELLGRHDMPAYPVAAQAAGVGYTDYLTGAHEHGPFNWGEPDGRDYVYTPHRNRQCSIGWHDECSDPDGTECGCVCHPLAKLLREVSS